MSTTKQLWPQDVENWAKSRWTRLHAKWLIETGAGSITYPIADTAERGEASGEASGAALGLDGQWPLSLNLNTLTEKDVLQDLAGTRAWTAAWLQWEKTGVPGRLEWTERRWNSGRQTLPLRLTFKRPLEVATLVGQQDRWTQACRRYHVMVRRWPQLAGSAVLGKHFGILADYSGLDFERLNALLSWLQANPASGLYLRQLPIAGFDTKWVEARKPLVSSLVQALQGQGTERSEGSFYALCGLRRPAPRIRMRVLCPELRKAVGGLCDIEATAHELAALGLKPAAVLIVENLESGLALPDLPGVVAFMRLGHAIDLLDGIAWLYDAPQHVYWGDLDTHGLAILARARLRFPDTQSLLMDEATLLAHRDLWVEEPSQHAAQQLDGLSTAELQLYQGLREQKWGVRVRLEQERLDWPTVVQALRKRFDLPLSAGEVAGH